MLPLQRGQLLLRDHAAPDAPAEVRHRAQRLGLEQDPPPVDDRHAGAQLAHVLDDVRGEKDDAVLAELGEQVEEPHALGRVEAGRRLVHDHQLRVAEEGDGDAEALLHAARVAAELLLAHLPQVHLPEERVHHVLPLALPPDPLEQREVVEQLLRPHVRIDAELLRQVAQRPADVVLLPHDVESPLRACRGVAQVNRAGVRLLERGEDAHQRGLAGAVGAEQAVHPRRDRERHVLQRLHAVGVGLGHASNVQLHGRLLIRPRGGEGLEW